MYQLLTESMPTHLPLSLEDKGLIAMSNPLLRSFFGSYVQVCTSDFELVLHILICTAARFSEDINESDTVRSGFLLRK